MTLLPQDVVDVQLVGQPWWESAAPYAALTLSVASIILTLVLQLRNDARVKATAYIGQVLGSGDRAGWMLRLSATNVGRTGQTVVNSIMLEQSGGMGLAKVGPESTDTRLPCPLAPGARADLYMDVAQLHSKLSDAQIDLLVIVVSTGHGDIRTPLPEHAKKQLKSVRIVEPQREASTER